MDDNYGEEPHRALFAAVTADLVTDGDLAPKFLPALFGRPPGAWVDLCDVCAGQPAAVQRLQLLTASLDAAGSGPDDAALNVMWTPHPQYDAYAVIVFFTTYDFLTQVVLQAIDAH
ncbi:MAG TPA: hypothetical protein VM490_24095 [Armatimonadaceae bacterium]|jgi:hypothetical protein|nr:hypothetical protein [Armatimonadaceae bacterium]